MFVSATRQFRLQFEFSPSKSKLVRISIAWVYLLLLLPRRYSTLRMLRATQRYLDTLMLRYSMLCSQLSALSQLGEFLDPINLNWQFKTLCVWLRLRTPLPLLLRIKKKKKQKKTLATMMRREIWKFRDPTTTTGRVLLEYLWMPPMNNRVFGAS